MLLEKCIQTVEVTRRIMFVFVHHTDLQGETFFLNKPGSEVTRRRTRRVVFVLIRMYHCRFNTAECDTLY